MTAVQDGRRGGARPKSKVMLRASARGFGSPSRLGRPLSPDERGWLTLSSRQWRVRRGTALVVTGLALTASLPMTSASADSIGVGGFEGYALGDVNQHGWSMTGAYDAKIVDPHDLDLASLGNRALRISNQVVSGSFGDQLFSPATHDEAGETDAHNAGVSGGTRKNHYEATFTFTSAQPGAEQAGLAVTVSPDRGDGSRQSFLRLRDDAAGLAIDFSDYVGGDFTNHTVATGLDRAAAHDVRLTIDFVEGPSNDIVRVFVNGELSATGTSWEDYYRSNPEAAAEQFTRTVDSLLFRASTAGTGVAGGFLFNDVAVETSSRFGACPAEVNGTVITLTADCETSTTLRLKDGWTLDGASHTITAVDPVGDVFRGDVILVDNGTADIRNLTVTTRGMNGDSRNSGGNFNGIRFFNASGSVTDTKVTDITHGNGVQEGRAVVIDNRDGGPQVNVSLDDIEVQRYQKSGVISYGNVKLIMRNSTIGSAADANGQSLAQDIAANAVTVFGGKATITGSHISGNEWNDASSEDSAAAVLALGGAKVTLKGNVLDGDNVDVGVSATDKGTKVHLVDNDIVRAVDGAARDLYGIGLQATNRAKIVAHDTRFSCWNEDTAAETKGKVTATKSSTTPCPRDE